MSHKVLITCGGTSEPIDDVRVLTNISTGRFGHALAAALSKYAAYSVTELCPKSTLERLGAEHGVDYEHFRSTSDLANALFGRAQPMAMILQAAAVSDYAPVRTKGKISSNKDKLTINLERTPKLIANLRNIYGPKTFLVGFKLLSDVPQETLIEAAFKQLKENRLNMVIANDLQNIKNGMHPILVITAEGGTIPISGTRNEVVNELAALIHQREQVNWFKSVRTGNPDILPSTSERFQKALAFVKTMNLLTDASGNISVRSVDRSSDLLVSPRGVDKSQLRLEDALPAQVDIPTRTIHFTDAADSFPIDNPKPSIDTGVESLIYEAYPNLHTVIHFHRGWGVMDVKTTFPYPCGVQEEGVEIIEQCDKEEIERDSSSLSVELVHHGFLLGLTMVELDLIIANWEETIKEFEEHLVEVNAENYGNASSLDPTKYQPIWHGKQIMGLIHNDASATVVYLTEKSRGTGLGRVIIDQLINRQHTIQTVDDCAVRDFYKKFGFIETIHGDVYRLSPPENILTKEY